MIPTEAERLRVKVCLMFAVLLTVLGNLKRLKVGAKGFKGTSLSTLLMVSLMVLAILLLSAGSSSAAPEGLTPRTPIYIEGNGNFTAANGVTSGSGTVNDPYIIESWAIDASTTHGILIKNTTAHFIVRNCLVENGDHMNGIRLENVVNGRIENNTCENNSIGILPLSSSNNTLSNNVVGNNSYGIWIDWYSDNNLISNNTCENNGMGIYLLCSSYNTLSNNTCSNNGGGILLSSSSNNLVSNNVVENNSYYGSWLYQSSNYNTLSNNIVENSFHGIGLYQSSNNTLVNNTFSNNRYNFSVCGSSLSHFLQDIDTSNLVNGKPIRYLVDNHDEVIGPSLSVGYLALVRCDNITVENLALKKNGQGILLASTKNSWVENCVFSNNSYYGIYSYSSSYNTLANNTCENNNSCGIYLEQRSSYDNLLSNVVRNNYNDGIQLSSSSNYNTLSNNTCENNSHGIGLRYSSNYNTLSNNTCENNSHGIWLESSTNNNHIHHNNLMNNAIQACDYSSNYWDDGYPSGGNYWSDYTGADNYRGENQDIPGGDGIGDTPYSIAEGANQDRYPLMNPWSPGLVSRPPILIESNENFTPANGVVAGSGTVNDPYIIENWVIDTSSAHGIRIQNTTKYFVIRNCLVENGRYYLGYDLYDGIHLCNVVNGKIENNTCSNNWSGIFLSSSSNNTLTNNTCSNNTWSIELNYSCNYNTLTNNTCSNTGVGILLLNSSNYNTLSNNTFSNSSESGILLCFSSNNTFSNNIFESCGIIIKGDTVSHFNSHVMENNTVNGKPLYYYADNTGITVPADAGEVILANCSNMTVENLHVSNTTVGVEIAFTENSIVKNNILSNNSTGIYLSSSSNNTFSNNIFESCGIIIKGDTVSHFNSHVMENNTVNGKPLYYYADNTGITVPADAGEVILANCSNMTVENLHVSNVNVGVEIAFTENSLVKNNILSSNSPPWSYNIWLLYSSNNTLSNNTSSGNHCGICLESSSSNTLTNNTCENSCHGILLLNSSSSNNTLSNNTCSNNGYGGITLWNSSNNNTISNNTCSNNYCGIYLQSSSNNNTIFRNHLINNAWNNAYDDGANYWDNNGKGNYWSDWQPPEHPDADEDGIVDAPRPIAGGTNQDSYPLVIPPTISEVEASNITQSSATITWMTDEPANSVVEYGTTIEYGLTESDAELVTSHSVTLTGLSAGTLYHYRVKSADAFGNTATSPDYTFTTSPPPVSLPDLDITSRPLQFSDRIPPPFLPNVLKISARVTNTGGAEAKNVIVKVFVGNPDEGGIEIGTSEDPEFMTLNPGDGRFIDVVCEFPSNVEDEMIYVRAYPLGQEDADFTNNTTTQNLSFYFADFRHDVDAFSFEDWPVGSFDDYCSELKDVLIGQLRERDITTYVVAVVAGPLLTLTGVGGHCHGMAAASTAYKLWPEVKPVDKSTFEMTLEEAKPDIIERHGEQLLWIFGSFWEKYVLPYVVDSEYQQVAHYIRDQNQPVMLALKNGTTGHAIVAYKILDIGPNNKQVFYYEVNFPYDDPSDDFHPGSSKSSDYKIIFKPISNQVEGCEKAIALPPWRIMSGEELKLVVEKALDRAIKRLWDKSLMLFRQRSPITCLITDEYGRRIGYINNTFVNEIPGSEMEQQLDSQLFYLPLDLTYTVGMTGTETGVAGIDIVIPTGESRARVAVFENMPFSPGLGATATLSATDITPEIVFDTGEIVKPKSVGEIDASDIIPQAPSSWKPISGIILVVALIGLILVVVKR